MNELLRTYAALDLDTVFGRFYDTMLSDRDFSIFFKDEDQIKSLIVRQKEFFLRSIEESVDEIKARYIKLGEMHYEINIPYIDFMAGIDILQDGLIRSIAEYGQHLDLLEETANFFRLIRTYSAKGYLNKMLDADIHDIDLYLSHVQRTAEVDISLSTERMIWLKNVIFAIKVENRAAAPSLQMPPEAIEEIRTITHNDEVLVNYVAEIASRMEVDAKNIFYFLDRHSYLEVLPLYQELMSIYKLALMLTNVVTIASTSSMVQALSKDALTGMLTRHALKPVFRRELAIAASGQYEISLIMVDVDNFKLVNDTFGHASGDEVLTKVARIATETIRATDFVFRLGGEEFLIVLKGASQKVALGQAELIRQEIEKTPFEFDGRQHQVTASFGVVTYVPPFEVTYDAMINIADEKMYESKHAGRNRVTY